MATTRIEKLTHVVTVDDAFTILGDATIEITDGVITAITSRNSPQVRRSGPETGAEGQGSTNLVSQMEKSGGGGSGVGGEVGAGAEVTVIDGRGKLALPGLVNLHTHLPMTLLRGLAENVDLQGFLTKVWAAEGAVMDPDTVRIGAELGALESLLAGVTTTLDMYFHHEAAHEGALATGARHIIGPVFFDGPGPDGLAWEQRLDQLATWPTRLAELSATPACDPKFVEKHRSGSVSRPNRRTWGEFQGEGLHRVPGPFVPAAAMPHSTYTCSPEHLREIADIVATWPADSRPLIHVHASENLAENADVIARHHATPTQVLDQAGLLHGIPNARTVLGHGVHLSPEDRAHIAASPGAAVAHCPGSNLKLASGALPWQTYRDAGVPLGLGTDGCASSNDLDLWAVMRLAAILARLTTGDPTTAPAEDIIRAATIEGARALGLDDLIGSLEVGKRADLVLIDLDAPHLTPVHDLSALLVFAAGRGDVTDVFVDGRHVVQDRKSTLIDTSDLLLRAGERGRVAANAAKDA
jgi:5-methylthioadenosine/S-adenosylhomocysteine deaminase